MASTDAESQMAVRERTPRGVVKTAAPLKPTRAFGFASPSASTVIRPGDVTSPVGTMRIVAAGAVAAVMLTISGVGASTEIDVTSQFVFANVNVQPCEVKAGTTHPAQATRKVAEPRTKSPTEPPRVAELTVALPLKATGPLMTSDPDTPADRIVVEM